LLAGHIYVSAVIVALVCLPPQRLSFGIRLLRCHYLERTRATQYFVTLQTHSPPLKQPTTKMKSFSAPLLVVAVCVAVSSVHAFTAAPLQRPTSINCASVVVGGGVRPATRLNINIGERERDALTRDSEPEQFFST
jgi:hypothetical protein